MRCIGALTEEYRRRIYGLVALYAKPLRADEPAIFIDEKRRACSSWLTAANLCAINMRQQLRNHRIQFGSAQAFEALDFDGLRIEHVCIVRGQLPQSHRCIFVLLLGVS